MDVTLPDGTLVRGIPEGTTKAQLAERLKKNGMTVPDSWMAPSDDARLADRIPGTPPLQTPPAQAPSTLMDKLKGAGEAGLSVASSIPAGLAGGAAGAIESITGGGFGTPGAIERGSKRAADVARDLTYEPRTSAGKEDLSALSDLVGASKIEGLNPAMPIGEASAGAGRLAKAAGGRTARAVTESPEVDLVRRAVKAAKPIVNPNKMALARVAQERFGMTLRPDMLSDNKFMRIIGEALENVPLSGSKVEQRHIAFNRAIGNLIGAERAERITPDVFDKAMTRSGNTIGEIAKKTNIPLFDMESGSGEFDNALTAFTAKATKRETSDVAKVVKGYVDEIREKAVDGVIPGETFRKINTEIGTQARRTTNGDLKHALGDLQDIMHDALTAQVSGPDLARLQEARTQYAIGKTIEPLVARSKTGDISPGGLMGAVTSDAGKKSMMARGRGGDLGLLARIGQAFLKEPGSSNTAERYMTYGVIGGSAFTEPHTTAGIYGAANLYNRMGPSIARRMAMKGMEPALRDTPIKDLP